MPDGFKNYAETAVCPIQLIIHDTLPLYATQAHPEMWQAGAENGRLLLQNFFR